MEAAGEPDTLLGGRIRLFQPERGYRAAIDPVLLAAAVPARAGEVVCELGIGTGAAALCLTMRVDGVDVVGLEKNPAAAAFARDNVALNRMADRVRVIEGDVAALPPELRANAPRGGFHHVFANPPYVAAGRGNRPPDHDKALAHVEGDADLGIWLDAAIRLVRSKGSITVINRADRLGEILAAVAGRLGGVVVIPLWPGAGKDARRVIVHGRKGVGTPLRLSPGLVLHQGDGRFTAEAETILRDAAPLNLG